MLALAAPLLLLGVALTIAFTMRPIGDSAVETDFYWGYAPRAERILEGHFRVADYGFTGPVFDLVLAGGGALGFPLFGWAKVVSALAMAAALALAWRIGVRLGFGRSGAAIPWLLLLSPAVVHHAYVAGTDALFFLLFSLAILSILRAESVRDAALAGAACLLATLTRYAGLLLVVAGVLAFRRERTRLLPFLATFLVPLGLAIGLLPLTGHDLPPQSFLINMDLTLSSDADPATAHDYSFQRKPWSFLTEFRPGDFGRWLSLLGQHGRVVSTSGAGFVLLALAIAGVIVFVRRAPRVRWAHPFVILGLTFFLSLLPFQPSDRYELPTMLWLAALGALALRHAARQTRAPLLATVLLAGFAWDVREVVRRQAFVPTYVLSCADEMRRNGNVPHVLVARKPHLASVLGARWVYFPDAADLPALRSALAPEGALAIFYGPAERLRRPQFQYLAFSPYRPPGWSVLLDDPAHESVVYAVDAAFFREDLPPDDGMVRQLMNETVAAEDPVPPARALAAYLARSGRCALALEEYDRLARFVPLTPGEEAARRACAAALGSE